jgi:hypothetical protein
MSEGARRSSTRRCAFSNKPLTNQEKTKRYIYGDTYKQDKKTFDKTWSVERRKTMKEIKYLAFSILLAIIILIQPCAYAEEGGGGHYMPGANASFIDALPGKPGLAVANFFNYYDASANTGRRLPFGGLVTASLDATAYSDTIVALYQTPLQLLGGHYSMGVGIPYVWMKVKGEARATGPQGQAITHTVTDKASGIGDILLYPFMLGWTGLNGDLKYDVRLGIYAPTGEYEKGKLANVGKNYWTFEPAASISYMSSKTGLELTAFAGMDFNTKNTDTEYRSGTQFHLDLTVAQHLPLFGGIVGIGANGFYYQQISGDSGSGAILGDFKGRTLGIGPALSYVTKICGKDFAAEAKWLPEMDVSKRLKGDSIWFKLAMSF